MTSHKHQHRCSPPAAARASRASGDQSDADPRTDLSPHALATSFLDNLYYVIGRPLYLATVHDAYLALAYTVRDRLMQRWIETLGIVAQTRQKVVCYFSAEFLVGPRLGSSMQSLGITKSVEQAFLETALKAEHLPAVQRIFDQRGQSFDDILLLEHLLDEEAEPGLGNGGLGRLAACYMESLASLEYPAIGYGIRYEFGIFEQTLRDGWQVELSDPWLRNGNPWEIPHPELAQSVSFGGHTESYRDEQERSRVRWLPDRMVEGLPYDIAKAGHRVNTCNTLRLWSARAPRSFDFQQFNKGDYYAAVEDEVRSETITKVLYPNDEFLGGKELRLMQQYFFVCCALQDMIRIHLNMGADLLKFHEGFAVQLNDTHPSIAIPELMRLLVDIHGIDWDPAWEITHRTFAYTNHTLLPEALEKWPLPLFQRILPRHLEIILEINRRFLDKVRAQYPGDEERVARISLIEESGDRYVRMAHLACVGSHAVNGVAKLHTELLKSSVLKDFFDLEPQKFHNVTNGVNPRRFIALINPRLAALLDETIGEGWLTDLALLRQLEGYTEDSAFRDAWRRVKDLNKKSLAARIRNRLGIAIDPASLFAIQVKRIHEYKRQHLNALHIVTLYNRLKQSRRVDIPPRTILLGGKAAPSYVMAKLIIKLINSIAEVVNNDPDTHDLLRVVFLPNFNVKNSRCIYPSADLSEQISTAGKEASGTGNMKFTMNGALTIGTLDGANVEIREQVGAENFFLFGLTAEEAARLTPHYHPMDYLAANEELAEVMRMIQSGYFSRGDRNVFQPLVDNLSHHDPYLVLADYADYVACQEKVSEVWGDRDNWTRMSILNTARSGTFSADRAVREYCETIWEVKPLPVGLNSGQC